MVFCKMLFGAALVLLIHFVSLSKNFILASLIPLFPTFTLIALYSVGSSKSVEDLQSSIIFGICAILPYLAYLISMYFMVEKYPLRQSLFYSTGTWFLVAGILVLARNNLGKEDLQIAKNLPQVEIELTDAFSDREVVELTSTAAGSGS